MLLSTNSKAYYSYQPNEWNKLGEHGAIVYVKQQAHASVCGNTPTISIADDKNRCRLTPDSPLPDEMVWCVRNRLGTIITRRNGKVAIVGNCGRVFRKFPTIKAKQIVQSKETRWPFIRTAIPEQQWVWQEDLWFSLKVNPLLNTINQNAHIAIATTEVELPTFLTKRPKGRK